MTDNMPEIIWADRSDDGLPQYKDTPFGIWWHDERNGYTQYVRADAALSALRGEGEVEGLAERLDLLASRLPIADMSGADDEACTEAATTLRALSARLEEAERHRDRALRMWGHLADRRDEQMARADAAEAREAKLREALGFYGDDKNWVKYCPDDTPLAHTEKGRVARAVLSAILRAKAKEGDNG